MLLHCLRSITSPATLNNPAPAHLPGGIGLHLQPWRSLLGQHKCEVDRRPCQLTVWQPHRVPPALTSPCITALQAKGAQIDMEVHDDRSLLALQGPEAVQVLQQFVQQDLSQVYFSNFRKLDIKGVPCFLTRTG